ncbi:tetratricopeptide repeat protein [Dactylosporangium sp. NPDC051541]|uniref:tetratricopeptide repeat protein n=1 Tax=Dactylosporangium sp. NPDC051541 TaxID=3363977 RepID=UPI0037A81CBA
MVFPDPNLGLAVLNKLIDAGLVPAPAPEEYDDDFGYFEVDTEVRDRLLAHLAEHRAAVAELTELSWDGGDDLQFECWPGWDGEDDAFTVTSLAGIEQCRGLRRLRHSNLIVPDDLTPLAGLARLEDIELEFVATRDWSPLLRIPSLRRVIGPVDAGTAEALRARGVFVRSGHSPLPLEIRCPLPGLTGIVREVLELPPEEYEAWVREHGRGELPTELAALRRAVVARAALDAGFAEALLVLAPRLGPGASLPAARHTAALLRGPARAEALELVAGLTSDDREHFEALSEAVAIRHEHAGVTTETLDLNARLIAAAWGPAREAALRRRVAMLRPAPHRGLLIEALNVLVELVQDTGSRQAGVGLDDWRELVAVLRDDDPPASAEAPAWPAARPVPLAYALAAPDDPQVSPDAPAPSGGRPADDLYTGPAALARALAGYGGRLVEAERTDEAVPVLREAADRLPDGAQERAGVLRHLLGALRGLGREDEAVTVARQRVEATPPGAEVYPMRSARTDLRDVLTEAGRPAEALAAAEDLVAAERAWLAAGPGSAGSLAHALFHVSDLYDRLDRPEAGAAASAEAAELFRAGTGNARVLAATLNNYANRLSRLRRPAEARAAAQEAVEQFRRLGRSAEHDRLLATGLGTLAGALGRLDRHDEAVAVFTEAVAVARRAAADEPEATADRLARALHGLAFHLSDAGRHAEAVEAGTEALAIHRGRAAAGPFTGLALTLGTLACALSELGRHDDARDAAAEGVDILRLLPGEDGLRADALTDYAVILSRRGDTTEAVAAAGEAVRLVRPVAARLPLQYEAELARSLTVLAEAGPPGPDSTAAADEAAAIRKRLATGDH